jgi:3-dehydroquinate dehydratase-2
MTQTIVLINGPNLNMLGTRQPEVYGSQTLQDVEEMCKNTASQNGLAIEFFQSNHEGEIIDRIQEAKGKVDGFVINPGAFSHTSVAIRDAFSSVDIPLWEVHISNIHAREEFRHHSYFSAIAQGVICGFGINGYNFAIQAAAEKLK